MSVFNSFLKYLLLAALSLNQAMIGFGFGSWVVLFGYLYLISALFWIYRLADSIIDNLTAIFDRE